jgi:hypothetical protein
VVGGGNGGLQISERNGSSVRERVLSGWCRLKEMEMGHGCRSFGVDGLLGRGSRSVACSGLRGPDGVGHWAAVGWWGRGRWRGGDLENEGNFENGP